jgi:hypothetical protein
MVAAALQYTSQSGPLRERKMTIALKLRVLEFYNLCPRFAQILPAAPGFAIPVCRAASCTASGDASASELKSISRGFRIK